MVSKYKYNRSNFTRINVLGILEVVGKINKEEMLGKINQQKSYLRNQKGCEKLIQYCNELET